MATVELVRANSTTQEKAFIRALRSITPQQVEAVTRAVQIDNQNWAVETIDDYDGYLSILIEPKTLGNDTQAYFITGTEQHLELLKSDNDDLTPIAVFGDIGDLSAELMGLTT